MERFRKQLLELRAALIKARETGDAAEQPVELDQTRVGRLSRMDALQAQAMSVETGRRRRQKLLQIESALRRLDEGERVIVSSYRTFADATALVLTNN